VLTALLLAPPLAQARSHGPAAAPGDFDYYLLSLSLAPSFCALSERNAAKPECRALTRAAFDRTPLTLHGLWPNRSRLSVNRQPQYCEAPPPAPLPAALQSELALYMPAGPGLARYEWRKHGACSGLIEEAYFTAAVKLARYANAKIGAVMQEQAMLGHHLSIADLLRAVATRDPELAPAIVVSCHFPRGGGPALVDEIRIVLSKDFTPRPAASVGFGQNSGCPQGAGFLPNAPPA
jgi:ribonuclease T2